MAGVIGGVIGGVSTTVVAPLAPKSAGPKAPVRAAGRVPGRGGQLESILGIRRWRDSATNTNARNSGYRRDFRRTRKRGGSEWFAKSWTEDRATQSKLPRFFARNSFFGKFSDSVSGRLPGRVEMLNQENLVALLVVKQLIDKFLGH